MGGRSTLIGGSAADYTECHTAAAATDVATRVARLEVAVVGSIVACCALASRCTIVGCVAARSPMSSFSLLSLSLNLSLFVPWGLSSASLAPLSLSPSLPILLP